jgi:hypothetical protein
MPGRVMKDEEFKDEEFTRLVEKNPTLVDPRGFVARTYDPKGRHHWSAHLDHPSAVRTMLGHIFAAAAPDWRVRVRHIASDTEYLNTDLGGLFANSWPGLQVEEIKFYLTDGSYILIGINPAFIVPMRADESVGDLLSNFTDAVFFDYEDTVLHRSAADTLMTDDVD